MHGRLLKFASHMLTRKYGTVCTDATPVLIRFNYDAHAKSEVAQPIRCPLIAFSLLICYVRLLLLTLTFYLWPWTFVVYRQWRGDTLYQIWVKSDNPWRSYCDLNIWPYDLEHVSCVLLCCRITCTKFKLSQHIHSWNVMIFYAYALCNTVTLTFNPLTLKTCGRSGVMWSN